MNYYDTNILQQISSLVMNLTVLKHLLIQSHDLAGDFFDVFFL